MNPIVSIIVPNYNHERFLSKRLDSIFNQTFQEFEVILLDDCSTDSSIHILQKYNSNDKLSTIFINETNSGSTFIQWDKGIRLAKGEFIWLAESDDFCSTDFLEELVPILQKNKQISLAFCKSTIINEIDQQSTFLGFNELPNSDIFNDGNITINGNFLIKNYMVKSNPIVNASAVIFRKKIYLDNFKKPISMKLFGDWYIWITIAYENDVYFHNKCLNFFRNHDQTVRQNHFLKTESLIDLLKIYIEIDKKKIEIDKTSLVDTIIYKYIQHLSSDEKITLLDKLRIHKILFGLNKKYIVQFLKAILSKSMKIL